MNHHFTTLDVLSMIALLFGVVFTFQILTLKRRTETTKYFAFYLSNITFIILFFFLLRLNLDAFVKYFTPLIILSELMMPVSLWIYLKKLTQLDEKPSYLKHYFFPVGMSILTALLILTIFLIKNEEIKDLLSTWLINFVIGVMTVGFLVLNLYYLSMSFILLSRHETRVDNYYSNTQEVNLGWIKLMLYAYIFLLIGLIVSNLSNDDWTDWVFYGVLIVFIVFTGHNALKQEDIWPEEKAIPLDEKKTTEGISLPSNDVQTETYTPAQLEFFKQLKENLEQYMSTEKPYLDHDLTIMKLATSLNTNTKYLSHVINNELHQNFINYINRYRIEEVKKLLLNETQQLTIEALAQNAGFKSKSTFNTSFKKATGITPSEFIKTNKVSHQSA